MDSKTQHGYLILADISGFTSYLARVELDHAHEILSDLLEAIVGQFKTLLTVTKLEGDAVFAHVAEARLPRGETLLELIEATYLAFRDHRDAAHRRTTCECNACRAIPILDLKFFVHHGDYIVQQVSGIRELVGSDVNLIHRLMKNHIAEATGWKAYALFTEAGLEHMGVRPQGMHAQVEAYEHLGEVKTHSLNLHPRFQELNEVRRVLVTPEEAHVVFTVDTLAPPPTVWEWLTDPHRIVRWAPERHMVPGVRPAGRTGVGARNHCVHGKKEVMFETVLDWKPFEHITVDTCNIGFPMDFLITHDLQATAAGTRLTSYWKFKLKVPLPASFAAPLGKVMLKVFKIEQQYADLARLIAEEAGGEPAAPALPASAAA